MKHVGQARLVYFIDPKTEPDQSVRCKSAFITIPHIHPGYDSKSTQCVSQRRIYLLTNILTWVYIDRAIDEVTNNRVDLNNRQKLCEVIMSSADTRLTESGFWRAFEGAKTELKIVWRLLRGDDLQGNKKPKVPPPSRSKNWSKGSDQGAGETPVFPMGQLDFQWINQDIDDSKPWSTMRTGRSDGTVMNFIEYSFINLSLDDVLERRFEDDSKFAGMASDKAAQEHVPRKAKKSSEKANIDLTTVSKALSADRSFVNAFPSTFTNATRVIPMYIPTANIVWMSEENVDDELEESIPRNGEEQLDPSQSSSYKYKSRKRFTDENTTMIKSSPKPSKPSNIKVTKSSEDLWQDLHFVNVFQSILVDNTQSMSNDTPVSDSGWVEEEGTDDMLGFNQDIDNECQPDSGLHASYLWEFVLDIKQTERTVGEPHSLERLKQAYRLWEAQIEGLHETLARVDRNRGAWESFLLDQPKDYWILGCFAAMESFDAMCPGKQNILFSHRPQDATNDWQHDFLQRRKAFQAACKDYEQRQQEWIESKQKRKKYKRSLKSIAEMDGSEVDIEKDCHMTIICRDHKGNERVIWVTVPRSARTFTWLDRRTIYFHTYGIDIRDENYSKCLPWASDAPATIPKERFLTSCYKEDVIWLWEQVTHIKYEVESPTLRIKDMPSQTYGAAGAPIPPVYTPTQMFVPYVDQPRENDGLWLLKEYLDEFYPKGGDFCTGTKEDFPKGNADIERFLW